MNSKTKIEWAEAVWNPVTGCTKVSPGCENCYAEREWQRLSKNPKTSKYFGRKFSDVQTHKDTLAEPLKRRKPTTYFVCSMGDLFHESVELGCLSMSLERIKKGQMRRSYADRITVMTIFNVMIGSPQHTFLILTKRPKRILEWVKGFGAPQSLFPKNIWIGVSVENRGQLLRIDHLRKIPTKNRFVSFEPLLGDMGKINLKGIKGVIIGGESGPNARPMLESWVEKIRYYCKPFKISFFYKQKMENGKKVSMPRLGGRIYKKLPWEK